MAKSRKNPTRGGGGRKPAKAKGRAKEASFEVEEQGDGAPAAGTSLETALVYVTFLALLVGLVMAQMDLAATYDMGMLGG